MRQFNIGWLTFNEVKKDSSAIIHYFTRMVRYARTMGHISGNNWLNALHQAWTNMDPEIKQQLEAPDLERYKTLQDYMIAVGNARENLKASRTADPSSPETTPASPPAVDLTAVSTVSTDLTGFGTSKTIRIPTGQRKPS